MDLSDPNAPKRILLVEDDDALANVYMMRLEVEGFEVRRAVNGEEALAMALDYHPDLMLLDIMMPKLDGFDVLEMIRSKEEIAGTKVIVITALSQDTDRKRAMELGADDYLVKSQVVIADVIGRVKYHLGLD